MPNIKELKDDELNKISGGGSTIVDGSTDYWRCLKWIHYCDAYEDNECKCDDFSSNDPICANCTHAAKSQNK